MKKSASTALSRTLSALLAALACGAGVALADDVHECNGVFTTEPCSAVSGNLKPGVSKVPSRELETSPSQPERPAPRHGSAAQGELSNSANSDSEQDDEDQAVTVYGDDDAYAGREVTPEEARRARNEAQARQFGKEGTNQLTNAPQHGQVRHGGRRR